MVEQYENNYTTTLNGAIDDDDTTITVTTPPDVMTGSFRIKIEDELILVGTVNGNDFEDCERGVENTTAASHADGTAVRHVLTAEGLLNTGGFHLISEVVLGSNSPTLGPITDIPQTYRDLVIVYGGRMSGSSQGEGARLQVGNSSIDTGANYHNASAHNGWTDGLIENTNGTYLTAGSFTSTSGAAGLRGQGRIEIIDYTNDAAFKSFIGQAYCGDGNGVLRWELTGGWANSTDPIERLQLIASSGNFLAGSYLKVYGRGSGYFSSAAQVGGPLLYRDSLPLETGGDEFEDPTLASWTLAGGLTTGDVSAVTSELYDGDCLDIVFGAQSDHMYKAIDSGDWTYYLTIHGITNSTPSPSAALGAMIALCAVDNSGNGTGVSLYDDNNAYMWAVASNAYSATGNTIITNWTNVFTAAASNFPVIYRLSKSGSTITGGISFDGGASYKTNTRSDSTTFTRIGIFRLWTNGGTNPTLRVGRFNLTP